MRDWVKAKYPVSVSSRIAGQKLATGRSWYQKGWLYSPKNKAASVPGATTLVSGQSVLAHAIAEKLSGLGCHPKLACRAARHFTDISDPLDAPGFDRNPGELFDGSFTYLAAYPDGEARIFRAAGVEKKTFNSRTKKNEVTIEKPSLDDVLIGIRKRDGAWLVPLDFIVKHVTIELDKYDVAERSEAR